MIRGSDASRGVAHKLKPKRGQVLAKRIADRAAGGLYEGWAAPSRHPPPSNMSYQDLISARQSPHLREGGDSTSQRPRTPVKVVFPLKTQKKPALCEHPGRKLLRNACPPMTTLERQAATSLLLKHWAGRSIPVIPEEIARAEGLSVLHLPDTHLDLSGEYSAAGGTPKIYFNPLEPRVRQRFTIAHELGHHILEHGPRYRDTAAILSGRTVDPIETSANRFAAELLMPLFALNVLVVDQGIASVEQLASSFEVSEAAMTYRLKNTGFLR